MQLCWRTFVILSSDSKFYEPRNDLQRLTPPLGNLVGMNIKLAGQPSKGFVLP